MAARIAYQGDIQPFGKTTRPKKRPDYLAFLHSLPCIVSGMPGVEAAHLSFAKPEWGHYGRAKGRKAPDRWCLPLSPAQHLAQHRMNEREFWQDRGINPHLACLVIHGLWSDYGDDAHEHVVKLIIERPWSA